MYRFLGHLCHFDFQRMCLSWAVCICIAYHQQILWSELLSEFRAGETNLTGNLSFADLTMSLFPSLWMGKCKRVSENRLLGPCFP